MRPGQAESTEAYDRPWKRVSTAALSLGAEEEQPTARVPGAGGCKGLILLRPLNAGRRLFPRKATCGWFWRYLLPPKGSYTPRHSPRFCLFGRAKKRTREQRMFAPVRVFACSRRTGRRTGRRASRSCQPQCKPRFLTGRRTGRRAGRSCQSQCKSRFLTGRTREQGRTPHVRVFAGKTDF